MQILKNISDFDRNEACVLTLGSFDGVHLGHQLILEKCRQKADELGAKLVLLTFSPHPRISLGKASDLVLLSDKREKRHLLETYGVDILIEQEFDYLFSNLSAADFVSLIADSLNPKAIIVGYDHRFGRGGEGNFEFFKKISKKHSFIALQVPEYMVDGITVSSSKIRRLLLEGSVELANSLLGYNFSLSGIVVKGRQIGRTIGFPTANIFLEDKYKIVPKNGVYLASVLCRGSNYFGMLNIGSRPTLNDARGITIEVNIFSFSDDIYGEEISVRPLHYIRDEKKFNNLDELKTQLYEDKKHSKALLIDQNII